MSVLTAFTTQLLRFFEELQGSFPEEREIRMATEAIAGAKRINPRLVLDLFYEHVYLIAATAIYEKDVDAIIRAGQAKISTQFNEMSPALSIFNKHWNTMGTANQESIWQYLTVLCKLCEKAKA